MYAYAKFSYIYCTKQFQHFNICSTIAEEDIDYDYLTDVNFIPAPLVNNQTDGKSDNHYEIGILFVPTCYLRIRN